MADYMTDIQEILRTALPAFASVYAAKKGNLNAFAIPFAQGRQQQEATRLAAEREKNDLDYRTKQTAIDEQRNRILQFGEENDYYAGVDRAFADQAAAENKKIGDALDLALENPNFLDMVNTYGAEGFSVPGMGHLDLKKVFDSGLFPIVMGPDGKYHAGKGTEPTKTSDLVPTPGPGGPTYQPKVAGGKVYERERVPRATPEVKKPTLVQKSVDGIKTYEISDPAKGITVTLEEADLDTLQILPEDLAGILRDPAKLQKLLEGR